MWKYFSVTILPLKEIEFCGFIYNQFVRIGTVDFLSRFAFEEKRPFLAAGREYFENPHRNLWQKTHKAPFFTNHFKCTKHSSDKGHEMPQSIWSEEKPYKVSTAEAVILSAAPETLKTLTVMWFRFFFWLEFREKWQWVLLDIAFHIKLRISEAEHCCKKLAALCFKVLKLGLHKAKL